MVFNCCQPYSCYIVVSLKDLFYNTSMALLKQYLYITVGLICMLSFASKHVSIERTEGKARRSKISSWGVFFVIFFAILREVLNSSLSYNKFSIINHSLMSAFSGEAGNLLGYFQWFRQKNKLKEVFPRNNIAACLFSFRYGCLWNTRG